MKNGLLKTVAAIAVALLGAAGEMRAQFEGDKTTGKRLDIYGFAMLDMGYDFKQNESGLVRRDASDQAPLL